VLVFHLDVTGSIPAASIFFLLDEHSLLFFHPLEPIISKCKKSWNVQEENKSQEPITFVLLALRESIISYNFFLWQALECSEISSPIIEPIEIPL
jgi:hypothetical protein